MIEQNRGGGDYMIGGVVLETIYWYTLLTCAGIAVFLLVFGDIFDFDGPIDPILIVPWHVLLSRLSFFLIWDCARYL